MIPVRISPVNQHRALGRLPVGQMNKTEARYARYLAEQQLIGAVLWWKWDSINLRLASGQKVFFKVDFAFLPADSVLTMADVKGSRAIMEEDALVKIKTAAANFPFRFIAVYPRKGGGWDEVEY